uniref:Uncharacterized protein n=1 Tax=Wuchereria bancrofti TaxID=6293 RepID=A0AAF5Q553_WUCBA
MRNFVTQSKSFINRDNGIKVEFTKSLEFNESRMFSPVEHERLPVNVLSLIITRQESMIEKTQIPGNIIDTLDMDTFITIILAMPLYIFLIIIISILFIRWRITLIFKSSRLIFLMIAV